MLGAQMTIELSDSPEHARFEARVDGELAGFAQYRLHGGRMTLFHTEVDSAHEGHGVGTELARYALEAARARGWQVAPTCPFIAGFIRDRPGDYMELVVPTMRDRMSA
jgi:predicted GNAT family acetyltransferase